MNKKEAKQKIHNLEAELAELKNSLDQPEGRWRAEEGENYYFFSPTGYLVEDEENCINLDDELYECGNYFQTEEEANQSNICMILNSEYEYYFAGVSDNWYDIPKETTTEWYSTSDNCWLECDLICSYSPVFNYRWKK